MCLARSRLPPAPGTRRRCSATTSGRCEVKRRAGRYTAREAKADVSGPTLAPKLQLELPGYLQGLGSDEH